MSNSTKLANPMKVITGKNTRWSYANVWEAKSINGGTPKFSVSLIIPKTDTVTVQKIKAAIQAAYEEGQAKLKGNGRTVPPLTAIKTPLRDGDTERPDDPAYYSIPEDTVGNYLNPASWKCTMIWSAYMGLPLSLEGVGAVLGLGKQKLTEGKELIKYFCQPCAPTKANGGRTRNLPENAPDKWAAFKRYNIRDVEVEMSIQEKLAKFPVPETVWEQYHLDQEINDRGVALDMELVHQAIRENRRNSEDLH